MTKILFVCMGNICRSPMAEGAFHKLASDHEGKVFHYDSAGTIGYHEGNPPDPRAQETALRRGMDISQQRSRKVVTADFDQFDYIMAMDRDNLDDLVSRAPQNSKAEITLFLNFANEAPTKEVPDPYYGGDAGFEHCLDLIESAAQGLFQHLLENKS